MSWRLKPFKVFSLLTWLDIEEISKFCKLVHIISMVLVPVCCAEVFIKRPVCDVCDVRAKRVTLKGLSYQILNTIVQKWEHDNNSPTQLFNNENTIITHQHKCRHYPQWLSQRPCYTTEESVNKAGALQSTLPVPTCRMFRTFLMSPCARRIKDSFPSSSMSIWGRQCAKIALTPNPSPSPPCRHVPALEESVPFPMVQSGTFEDLIKSLWIPFLYLVHLLCSAGMILLR